MIVTNVGAHCLIICDPEMVKVQPALTGVEIDILREIGGKVLTISGLSAEMGCSYAAAWVMVHRLERRGLLTLRRNCSGMTITPLATLLEAKP